MPRSLGKKKEEGRRLYLSGEMTTNAEIAQRLRVKAHTVGQWRKSEDWDGLRMKIDRRAAELFVEKIASDRTTLNLRHYKFWDLLLANLGESLKGGKLTDPREMERVAGILDKAQKGQRLAKGLSEYGETEEAIRAQGQADTRRLIDCFIDSVKEHVEDESSRDRIRKALMQAMPEEKDPSDSEGGIH